MSVAENRILQSQDSRAGEVMEELVQQGVHTLALVIVDPGGVVRVKCIPASRLDDAVVQGIGFSRAISVMPVYDLPTYLPQMDPPIGDLRIVPDLDAVEVLVARPGLAWIPADMYDQQGSAWPACPRLFLKRMVEELQAHGLAMQGAYEFEWFQGTRDDEAPQPAHRGPGYSASALSQSEFVLDLLQTLAAQGIRVQQFHPEIAEGQYELSVTPRGAVEIADTNILVRQVIRDVAHRYGDEASFSPKVFPIGVGNGAHFHFSLWSEDGRNAFAGGPGALGMTGAAESFAAGVLRELPALAAITSPSMVSYLRLLPQHWSGAYQCWGPENREAPLRFVRGMAGRHEASANFEFKTSDFSANPYLAIGALIAAGIHGVEDELTLPPPVEVDPARLTDAERDKRGIDRLPASLEESVQNLEKSSALRSTMGDLLFDTFVAVRRAEIEAYRDLQDDELVKAHRWRY